MASGARMTKSSEPQRTPDPERIETLPELKAALAAVRGPRSYSDLRRASKAQADGKGPQQALAASTVSNLLNGGSLPRPETVETFLIACGLDDRQARAPWLRALERVSVARLRRPGDAVRVRDARAVLLGVHPAIRVESESGTSELPAYVPRDLDGELHTALSAAAAGQGGFVLLLGDSSAGKTRSLYEGVRAMLSEWWLIHPDAAGLAALQTLESEQARRTIVWLDELSEHLETPAPLTAATARHLIGAGMVLVGTLWSDDYTDRAAARAPGRPDPHADARKLLDLAHLIEVSESFSPAERYRAESLAADRRIRVALDNADVGVTQFLAAAPQLEKRWTRANPYAKALITAALDVRRLGARAPLSSALLEAAGPAYLTPTEQSRAPREWFRDALAYATTPLHGAASVLTPTGAMGTTTGYLVADYLHQRAMRARRALPVPEAVWRAVIVHHDPWDDQALARSALAFGKQEYAEFLYRRAADGGDTYSGMELGRLLIATGRIDELRARSDGGDQGAKLELVSLLTRQGNHSELRTRSLGGDPMAARALVAELLGSGRLEEALQVLRTFAEAGDRAAARYLEKLLAERRRLDDLRSGADEGDEDAAWRLAELLEKFGGVQELRVRADRGDRVAAHTLAGLLGQKGEVDELRSRADAGDPAAVQVLAGLLVRQGNDEEALSLLRARADAGDRGAACHLADILVEGGASEEAEGIFRALTRDGHHGAWYRFANLLAARGDLDGAMAVLLDQPHAGGALMNASPVAEALARAGRLDDLRVLADAGNKPADDRLAGLLAEGGQTEELQARAEVAGSGAAWQFSALLARTGRLEELRDRAEAGDPVARFLLDRALLHSRRSWQDAATSQQVTVFLPEPYADLDEDYSPRGPDNVL